MLCCAVSDFLNGARAGTQGEAVFFNVVEAFGVPDDDILVGGNFIASWKFAGTGMRSLLSFSSSQPELSVASANKQAIYDLRKGKPRRVCLPCFLYAGSFR